MITFGWSFPSLIHPVAITMRKHPDKLRPHFSPKRPVFSRLQGFCQGCGSFHPPPLAGNFFDGFLTAETVAASVINP